jgi:nicotinate-nucleotide--dimethylbenzimidazole phosphoribosyltransferase
MRTIDKFCNRDILTEVIMPKDALNKYLSQIKILDIEAMARVRARLDNLAKPPGSLGKLEDIAVTLAGISGGFFLI